MSDNEPAPGNNNRTETGSTPFWKSPLFWTVVGSVGTLATPVSHPRHPRAGGLARARPPGR